MPKTKTLLLLQALALSSVAFLILHVWEGSRGFNLWDEGFVWYGAQRVMEGEVPLRDFMAYDPGRYYWSAGLMRLLGDNGLMAFRMSAALFQTAGLFVGLLWIARSIGRLDPVYLLLAAVTLVAWMHPRHTFFDMAVSLFLVGALAFLVEQPSTRRCFIAGFCIGLAAVFGRNHGVYGAIAGFGILVWLSVGRQAILKLPRAFAVWAAGIAAGFAPMLAMLLIPGFAAAFWRSIAFVFELKGVTIPLPVPWPWRVDFSQPLDQALRDVLGGILFLVVPAYGVLSILWLFRQRLRDRPVSPALVAASFLVLPYAHRAFSRAAIGMLTQAMIPLLVACLALVAPLRARVKWPLAILLCGASLWMMHVYHEGWQCRAGQPCAKTRVSEHKLKVMPYIADDVALLRALADKYAPGDAAIYVTPFWPGAYALLERRSPTWEIFALFPRTPEFEQEEIARLEAAKPQLAFVYDFPLDGSDALRFRNTHPLIFQWILDHFDPVESPNPAYLIFKAKTAAP